MRQGESVTVYMLDGTTVAGLVQSWRQFDHYTEMVVKTMTQLYVRVNLAFVSKIEVDGFYRADP
jgi:sRNA-binding regulator protein Hfq